MSELVTRHSIHPNMIAGWTRHAVEGMPEMFDGKIEARDRAREDKLKELHAKIGQLVIERDLYEGLLVKGQPASGVRHCWRAWM